jgi:hypothetical protein
MSFCISLTIFVHSPSGGHTIVCIYVPSLMTGNADGINAVSNGERMVQDYESYVVRQGVRIEISVWY